MSGEKPIRRKVNFFRRLLTIFRRRRECRKILDLLPEFVAGVLSNEETFRVLRHILRCPRCSEEEKAERLIRAIVVEYYKRKEKETPPS